MTIIVAIIALLAVILWAQRNHHANRAANLQRQTDYLAERVAGLSAALDDAERTIQRLHTSNGYLIREASVLGIDLAHSEAHSDYLAACLRQRRGNSAGWLMLAGLCRSGWRMRVLDGAGGGP